MKYMNGKKRMLTQVREESEMNRADLSRAAKIQPSVIGWIETGRFIPYDSQLEKIAAALGWEGDIHELLKEVE